MSPSWLGARTAAVVSRGVARVPRFRRGPPACFSMQRGPSPRSLLRPSARSTAGRLVAPDADPGGAGRRPTSGRPCRGSRCTISFSRSTVRPATSPSDEGTDADDRTIVTCSRRCRAQGLQNRAAGARLDRGDGAGPRAHAVRNHCRQIAQALGKPDPWASASTRFSLSSPRPARRPALKRDPCAKGELAFGRLPHGLWVHPEVPDGLGGMTPLRQRLGIVLQHLAAHRARPW